jgi:hypothetical protein
MTVSIKDHQNTVSLITTYGPNKDEDVENTEKLYEQLQNVLHNNTGRIVIVLRDLKCRRWK